MSHQQHSKPGVYSQNDEQLVIEDYVSRFPHIRHKFLEIGAYDPIALSNTRKLVESGWGGVYVEPAPENAARFLKEYANREDILLVNAAVDKSSVLRPFYDSGGDAVGSFSSSHVAKWSGQVKFTKYLTKTITVDELLSAVGTSFGFINLDVEGVNFDMFRVLPLATLVMNGLKLICVEHDGLAEEMLKIAEPHGFKQLSRNPENVIMGR